MYNDSLSLCTTSKAKASSPKWSHAHHPKQSQAEEVLWMANVSLGLEELRQLGNINKTFSELRIITMLSEIHISGSGKFALFIRYQQAKWNYECPNSSPPGEGGPAGSQLVYQKQDSHVAELTLGFIGHFSPAHGLRSHQWLKVHGILYLPHSLLAPKRWNEHSQKRSRYCGISLYVKVRDICLCCSCLMV